MPYQFALERPDFSALASGAVLYSLPGHPAFPIRLTSEIFLRCLELRKSNGVSVRQTVYDPCCGTAYQLSALVYLHGDSIGKVIASDIDGQAVQLAKRNLELVCGEGLAGRIRELEELHQKYGKASHLEALASARKLMPRLADLKKEHPVEKRVFQADALDGESLRLELARERVDIVLTDIPYGRHSRWQGQGPAGRSPAEAMLEALLAVLHSTSLVAVVSDKSQKVSHDEFTLAEKFHIGKRQIVILKLCRKECKN